MGNRVSGIALGVGLPLGRGPVVDLVVRERVAVGADDLRVHQRRPLPGPGVLHRLGQHVVGGEHVAAVHFLDEQAGKAGEQLGDRAARRVDLDRHRDGVAVVLHQEDHRQLEVGGGVERLPELALAGGAVAGGAENHFVALDQLARGRGMPSMRE